MGRARVTCRCVTGLRESQTGGTETYLPKAGRCRVEVEWRGKGEATKGSEGLKKSELSQGGLERQEQ